MCFTRNVLSWADSKKPVFDEVSRCYRIQWSDMAYLTESIVVDRMYVTPENER